MRLAIVGSRNFHDYNKFKLAVLKILDIWNYKISDIECIVSGGAPGTDTLAEKFAKEFNIHPQIYRVSREDWRKRGNSAGPLRNTKIVNDSTHMIAFPSHSGKGTQDSINKFKALHKLENLENILKVLYID